MVSKYYNTMRENKFQIWKLLFLPLFFCLSSTNSFAYLAFRDTIILDSTVVEIDPEWEIDTVYRHRSELRKLLRHIDVEAGLSIGKANLVSELKSFQTIEEFKVSDASVILNPFVGIDLALGRQEEFYVRSGVRISRQGWNNDYFNESDLDDSLYRFMLNPEGNIDQILLFRYQGLGSETDTIPLKLESGEFRYWTIDIPLRFCYQASIERSNSSLEVSLGLINRFRFGAKSSGITLLNEDGERDYIKASEVQLRTFGLVGNAGVAWNLKPNNQNWSLGLRTDFSVPINSEVSSVKFSVQRLETNVGLFFRIFLD